MGGIFDESKQSDDIEDMHKRVFDICDFLIDKCHEIVFNENRDNLSLEEMKETLACLQTAYGMSIESAIFLGKMEFKGMGPDSGMEQDDVEY